MKLGLYWHTVRHLRPVQIYGRLLRRRPRVRLGAAPVVRERMGEWVRGVERGSGWLGGRRFRFLQQEREIVSWNDAGTPKLWLYNLHYQAGATVELMEWWRRENAPGEGNGWEPYPLSLRIVNWVRCLLETGGGTGALLDSLAVQARHLEQSVEWHLLGNHLFANGKALVFAGLYFGGEEGARWRRAGEAILERELGEQVLGDGGHFERSPMYHALALEDMLDLVNVYGAYGERAERWREAAGRMLGWMGRLTHGDGELAFFNDTTGGVAAGFGELSGYGERIGVVGREVVLGESGFMRLERDGVLVLMDGGSVGPGYQPGHAHAETLAVEVSRGARRVVVNAGISTYEKNAQRQRERGTAAHSTVMVDGADSSEVWGGFRVARRARVVRRGEGLEAEHDGYGRLGGGVRHGRRVEIVDGAVRVTDWVTGRGRHRVEVLFHLALGESGELVVLDGRLRREERVGEYHRRYSETEAIVTVAGVWEGELPVEFVTVVRG